MSFKKLVRSSLCTAVLCTSASAQETRPIQGALPQQVNANQETGRMANQGMVTPQQLAMCWALDNQEEVILAKFAQEKSKNKDVASFAKMIAEEHQSCLKKLSKFAPEASREGYLNENPSSAPTRNVAQPAVGANGAVVQNSATNGAGPATIDMMQFQREIAQQCVADSKKYLNTKDGEEFDKCFVGMQIGKHAAMHTKLVVMQRHTTNEMQQMIAEGIQATEKHMKAAESLMKTLDNDDASSATSATEK